MKYNVYKISIVGLLLCFGLAFSQSSAELLKKGKDLLKEQSWSEASSVFRRATIYDPKNADIFYWLGRSLEGQGNDSGAEIAYKKSISLKSKNPYTFSKLGNILLRKGKVSEAESLFKKSFKLNSDHLESKVGMATIAAQKNKSKDVLGILENVSVKNSYAGQIHSLKGIAYYELKNYDYSASELKQALKITPNQAKLWNKLGDTYYKMGRFKDSESAFKSARSKKNVDEEFATSLGLGLTYYAQKNTSSAQKELLKASKLNRNDVVSKKYLARIFLSNSDHQKAEKFSRQALSKTSKDAELYFILGYSLEQQKKYSQAAQAFSLGLKLNPKNENARLSYASSLVKSNKKSDALNVLVKLSEDKPQNYKAWELLSYLYAQRKSWSSAEEAAAKFHTLKSPTKNTAKILSIAQFEQNKYNKTIQSSPSAIQLNPKDDVILLNFAVSKEKVGQNNEAIKILVTLTARSPRNTKAQFLLANLYFNQKKFSDSYKRFSLVNIQDKKNSVAWVKKAEIDLLNKKPDQAIKNYNSAIKYNSRNAKIRFDLAKVYITQKNFKAAQSQLQKATVLQPKNGTYHAHLGYVKYEQKNFSQAIPSFEAALKNGQSKSLKVNEKLGHSYVETKSYKNAVSPLSKAISIDANSLLAWRNLAYAQKNLGKWQQAAEAFSKASILDAKNEVILSEKAYALNKSNQKNKAISSYQDLIKLNPKLDKAHYALGELFEELNDNMLAQKNYLNALKLLPGNSTYKKSIVSLSKKQIKLQDKSDSKQALLGYYDVDKNNSEVNYLLGKHYFDEEKYKDAISYLQSSVKIKPNYWQAQKILGLSWYKMSNEKKALSAFKQSIKYQSKQADIHWNIGKIEMKNKNVDAASLAFQRATLIDSKNHRYHFDYAKSLKVKKRPEEALSAIKRAIKYNSKNKSYVMFQSELLEGMNKPKIAAKSFLKVTSIDSTDEKAWLGFANNSKLTQRWSDAVKGYDKSVALNSKNERSYYGLGFSQMKLKKYSEATMSYEQAIAIKKDYAQAYSGLGAAYLKLKQSEEANKAFEGARKYNAKDVVSRRALASSYMSSQKYKKANLVLLELTKLDSKNSKSFFNLGQSYYKLNNYKLAQLAFKKSLSINGKDAKVHFALAKTQIKLSNNNAALDSLNKAISYDRRFAEPYYEKSKLISDKNSGAKIVALKKAIALKKDYVAAHRDLGTIYYGQGNFEAAASSYLNVMKYDSTDRVSVMKLSEYYVDKSNSKKAISLLKVYVEKNPSDAKARFSLAKVYYANGQKDDSARELDRALVDDPDFAEAQVLFGLILLEQKDVFGAQERFDRAKRINPNLPEVYYGLGTVEKENGNDTKAIRNLEKAVSLNNNYQEAYLLLGDLYKAKGMQDKASEAYGKSAQVKSLTGLKKK